MESINHPDWDCGTHSSLVSIGTHSLHASIHGPDRKPNQPIIILFPGVTSTTAEWPVAIKLISSSYRILSYDRSGFGLSEKSPNPPSPNTITAELNALLQATKLKPPYVTLGHSWGGILSLDFYHSHPADVTGMIFIDASAPNPISPNDNTPWTNPALAAVMKDLDWFETTRMTSDKALSGEQWQAFLDGESTEKYKAQAALELVEITNSYKPIVEKKMFNATPPLLGHKPVCVLKAHSIVEFERMWDAGIKQGNGTEQERSVARKLLDEWDHREVLTQRQFITLSENTEWMETDFCGHNVQLIEPGKIADAVRWTMEHF